MTAYIMEDVSRNKNPSIWPAETSFSTNQIAGSVRLSADFMRVAPPFPASNYLKTMPPSKNNQKTILTPTSQQKYGAHMSAGKPTNIYTSSRIPAHSNTTINTHPNVNNNHNTSHGDSETPLLNSSLNSNRTSSSLPTLVRVMDGPRSQTHSHWTPSRSSLCPPSSLLPILPFRSFLLRTTLPP